MGTATLSMKNRDGVYDGNADGDDDDDKTERARLPPGWKAVGPSGSLTLSYILVLLTKLKMLYGRYGDDMCRYKGGRGGI